MSGAAAARLGPGQKSLPEGWRWVRLGEVCHLNPRRASDLERKDDAPTSFVPMAAIDDRKGVIASTEIRPFAKVRKGYTCFREGDVLFAKITPCMENGKHAVARGLIDGIGFGTTEFHVLRPGEAVISEWVHAFVRQPSVLTAAARCFIGTAGQQRVPEEFLRSLELPLPPLPEQRRIAARLSDHMAAVDQARAAAETEIQLLDSLVSAYLRQSLSIGSPANCSLGDALLEVSTGVGSSWADYRVVGATRDGLAPAKEKVGRNPERYKLVEPGTVFYNPMRILIGSIAMIDEGQEPGITSPDYVVFKTREPLLHPRWFYYWLRSAYGAEFIKTLARGAVRERMLFRRLVQGTIDLPKWHVQCDTAARLLKVGEIQGAVHRQMRVIESVGPSVLRQAFNGEL